MRVNILSYVDMRSVAVKTWFVRRKELAVEVCERCGSVCGASCRASRIRGAALDTALRSGWRFL
jgi:hypothetical protein